MVLGLELPVVSVIGAILVARTSVFSLRRTITASVVEFLLPLSFVSFSVTTIVSSFVWFLSVGLRVFVCRSAFFLTGPFALWFFSRNKGVFGPDRFSGRVPGFVLVEGGLVVVLGGERFGEVAVVAVPEAVLEGHVLEGDELFGRVLFGGGLALLEGLGLALFRPDVEFVLVLLGQRGHNERGVEGVGDSGRELCVLREEGVVERLFGGDALLVVQTQHLQHQVQQQALQLPLRLPPQVLAQLLLRQGAPVPPQVLHRLPHHLLVVLQTLHVLPVAVQRLPARLHDLHHLVLLRTSLEQHLPQVHFRKDAPY